MSNIVEILVKAKDDTAGTVKAVDSRFGKLGGKLDRVGQVAGKALAGGLLVAGAAAVKLGQAAADDEAAASKLEQTLRSAAGATDQQVASTEAWIAAQGKALGITDDELRPAIARLTTATKDVGEAQKLTALAMDISAGSGKSLQQVTEALQKGVNGSVGGLSRLGVATKDAAGNTKSLDEITAELASTYEGAAAKSAETTAGKQKILTTQLAELGEQIGAVVLPAMLKLSEIGMQMIGWVSENTTLVGVLVGVLAGTATTLYAVSLAMRAWGAIMKVVTIATKAWALAQKALNLVMRMNPLGMVLTAIGLLIGALILAYKKSDTFRRIVDGAFRAVQKGASFAFGWVKENWPLLLAILTGPFAPAVIVIAKNKDKILGFFKAIPGKIKGFFSGLAGFISAPFEAAFNAIKWLWNSTVGGFGFNFGGWDPPGPGSVPGVSFTIPEMAHGGIAGGLISVGERGRELIRVPHGSTVIPNGQTEAMLAGGGRGGRMVLELRSSGSKVDNLLVELLRGAIRAKGGNVQVVLGQAGR